MIFKVSSSSLLGGEESIFTAQALFVQKADPSLPFTCSSDAWVWRICLGGRLGAGLMVCVRPACSPQLMLHFERKEAEAYSVVPMSPPHPTPTPAIHLALC